MTGPHFQGEPVFSGVGGRMGSPIKRLVSRAKSVLKSEHGLR
jgi:hypothetical protein